MDRVVPWSPVIPVEVVPFKPGGDIYGVTGIPPTENQAIRSKGDAYREYQKRVSRFVPRPPKARISEA